MGPREATPILLDGLKRLEYRGYDSAGIAVVGDDGEVRVARSEGKLGNLTGKIASAPPPGRFGIGHTRWATHGRPSEENAHPHRDASGRIVVIHNGIIENFLPLKQGLQRDGVKFLSETDTEVVAHALAAARRAAPGKPFAEVVRETAAGLKGMYAARPLLGRRAAASSTRSSGARRSSSASGRARTSSPRTRRRSSRTRATSIFLEDGDLARVTADGVDRDGLRRRAARRGPRSRVPWDAVVGREGRLPALHGQGDRRAADRRRSRRSATSSPSRRASSTRTEMGVPKALLGEVDRIQIVACGTSWHAGLVAKFLLEEIARVPDGRRLRVRVPVPRAARRRPDARRRDLAVGRDGRHRRGPQGSEGARRRAPSAS